MGLPTIFLTILLLRSALAITDDLFEDLNFFVPEDETTDIQSLINRQARANDKFLRFGRGFWDYVDSSSNDMDGKEVAKPSRTGRQGKNDQFIRFGRSNRDILRFTESPQQRAPRDKSSFLRFGRSADEGENKKKRSKRAAISDAFKRHENYLRFGRTANSNFMRFGRNLPVSTMKNSIFNNDDLARNKLLINYLKNLLRRQSAELENNVTI